MTRDKSQRRFLAQHSVAPLLPHCFEWLQRWSNIATMCCTKNRRVWVRDWELKQQQRRRRPIYKYHEKSPKYVSGNSQFFNSKYLELYFY